MSHLLPVALDHLDKKHCQFSTTFSQITKLDFPNMNKTEVSTCECCGQEFEATSSLLRHVSHKESCKNFYGEDRILQMRWNGKRMAKNKWNQSLRYKRKQENKSSVAKLNRSDENNNGPYYPYIPERVRQWTIEGVVFHKLFKKIYEDRKKEALEEFQDFAMSSVFKRCVDVTLDEVFNEENLIDRGKIWERSYENRRRWLDDCDIPLYKNYIYFPHFTSDDFLIANLEKELESQFNSRLKKEKDGRRKENDRICYSTPIKNMF